MTSVTVKIENAYSDGHCSTHEVELTAPGVSGPIDWHDPDLEEWFEAEVYPHTGDGHGAGTELGSCYTATIIAAADPSLIGASAEWMD